MLPVLFRAGCFFPRLCLLDFQENVFFPLQPRFFQAASDRNPAHAAVQPEVAAPITSFKALVAD